MARVTAEEWIEAAYERFSAQGLAAVRVEAVARDLGATKGSFYWHFADRAELVAAVMRRWEQLETDFVIELVERTGTAEERLARLYDVIVERMGERGGERTLYIGAGADGVADAVARVTERRVSYVAQLLVDTGFDPGEARRRGAAVVAAVIGFQQLAAGGWRAGPGVGTHELTATLLAMTLGREHA
ncbi:TetR/AcrR family transcriptional regulator [Agromyces aurantiacus]|uniref:TetR/AcrR family transcriptional regulator n=1 Tax=Agromyces aurantiacus TaxID=165814 RepID=A0ABV9R1X0_9MICO|nr:TetR/AcrR family transcriptional regulator [Agromyces aurantiacus]MBM7506132.1 AcrR family transcriptional regulator [Agromyces aurantiacus]